MEVLTFDKSQKHTNVVPSTDKRKKQIFLDFVDFMALPDPEKYEFMGIQFDPLTKKYPGRVPTLTQFALKVGVARETLSRWKAQPEFLYLVEMKRKQWGVDKIPNVLAALYTRCLKYGMAYDVETYLAYFTGWTRSKIEKESGDKFDADDLRSIIAQLPEQKQKEAYAKIGDIIAEAELLRSRSQGEGHSS